MDNTNSSQFESDTGTPIKVGESARYLASYLEENQYLYTEEHQAVIHVDELAYVIQQFYDTLP